MKSIPFLMYLVILAAYFISAAIILYHIARFSYSKKTIILTAGIFLLVFGLLIAINLAVFLAIDWGEISTLAE